MNKLFCDAVFAAAALCVAAPVLAGETDPAGMKKLHDYALSMDKVNAMQAAMDDIKKAQAGDPVLRQQAKSVGDDSKTIAEMEARIMAIPHLAAIYRRHGLTADDVVLMPFVLMDAGVAAQYPAAAAKLSDRMSPAQVTFYKQHQAELKKTPWLFGG